MTPLLVSGQTVTIVPVTSKEDLKIGDIVFCKVRGRFYVHKIYQIRRHKDKELGRGQWNSLSETIMAILMVGHIKFLGG